jgi:hypothetical protein
VRSQRPVFDGILNSLSYSPFTDMGEWLDSASGADFRADLKAMLPSPKAIRLYRRGIHRIAQNPC